MHVEQSYYQVSKFFDSWVRLMEIHTRRMEVVDSGDFGSKILIISPPTDTGIQILAGANAYGQTNLLCFSERIEQIAVEYRAKHGLEGLQTYVEPFFHIPFPNESLSAVYANCLFDFCSERDFDVMFNEIWRALKKNGSLFAVYMGPPSSFLAQTWVWIFKRFHFLSQGCHPVCIAPYLSRRGFRILKEQPVERLGFPITYIHTEKPAQAA